MNKFIFIFFFFIPFFCLFSQEITPFLKENQKNILKKQKPKKIENQKSLWSPAPIKAALYSAILPGMGQFYNKRYWKSPLMIGALTGGVLLSLYQRKIYQKHQTEYINAVNGIESPGNKSNLTIISQLYQIKSNAQRYYNYVVLFTIIGYVLNIMDGFVDAHLDEIRKDKQLRLSPIIIPGFDHKESFTFGMSLSLNF